MYCKYIVLFMIVEQSNIECYIQIIILRNKFRLKDNLSMMLWSFIFYVVK